MKRSYIERKTPLKRTGWDGSLNRTPIKKKKTRPKKVAKPSASSWKRKVAYSGPSEQTRKTYEGQRIWSLWIRRTQVAFLYETEALEHGRCEKCGSWTKLEADHVTPKSNFKIIKHDPLNGQVLCHWDNSAKGSEHAKEMDYRSLAMKRFYAKVATIHWVQYGVKGIWQTTDAGALWIKSKQLVIPPAFQTAS